MKRKIYKLLSSAKQGLFALALTAFSGTAYSQVTHTFIFTGSTQSIALPAGNYSIECWGADGGDGNTTLSTTFGGKGGYSKGVYNNPTTATLNIYVGGHGGNASGTNVGGGGGGMSDVTTATNTNVIIIAAGGGGGGTSGSANESSIGGGGGGLVGGGATDGTGVDLGTSATGGSQTAGGFAVAGLYGAGNPGGYGYGGGSANGSSTPASPSGTMHAAGGIGGNGGNGGWNGGGAGCLGTNGNNHSGGGGAGYYGGGGGLGDGGAGGGGSSFIGGLTSAATIMFGQPGFVTNPDLTGNGRILITELCSISLTASGSNSLNPSICAGQNLTLTTDGISNYAWSTGNTTNSTIVVSPVATTVYTLSAMSPSSCVAAKSITVTVSSALPVLTITNTPNSICLGKTATLTAGGALTYTWAGGPGGVMNGQTFTPTATSGYTVTGENGCGQSTASTTITIAPLAVSVASSSNNICSGSSAVLTATSAVTGFTWMPGGMTGTNVTVSPLVNTVYTLTASDGTCTGVATLSLDTKPIPTLSIAATATDVCEGSAITLTVTGANTYTWVTPASNSNIITVNPPSATSYVVSGTNASNCTSAISQIVVTKPNPVVNVSTNKPIVCEAGSATLTASGGSTSYSWINGPATNTNAVNPTVSTTYTVTGTGANNCTTDKTITVNVLSVSVAVSSTSMTICEGQSAVLNASGATTYTWIGHGNFANATVSPTLTTTYSVVANTTSSGLTCPSSNSITITVNALPTVSVSATKTTACKMDANIIITASGASTYSWSPTLLTNTISVHPQSTTTYSVTGTDANGCQDVASVQIIVSPCTGINEFAGSGKIILVYPNPSNGEFTVNTESDMTLKVMNELGQLVQTLTLNNQNDHKVSVKDLANGIYFIVGQNQTETVTQKVVVSK